MWATRPFLRRGFTRVATPLATLRRFQHGYPPHKEYFQQPGQAPLPEQYVAYQRPPPAQHATFQSQRSSEPSHLRRGFRSILWLTLFGTLGFVAGTGLITWEYINTPVELDEEEEEELLQDILEELRLHPLVESLMEEKWHALSVYPTRSREEMEQGMEFLYEKLMGTRGITVHEFTHPTSQYTVLVFYLADGLEGWPDTIHGGVITSMLLLAAKRHVLNHYNHQDFALDPDMLKVDVNFMAPVHPEDVYSILVGPAQVNEVSATEGAEASMQVTVAPMLMQMEAAPQIEIEVDEVAQAEKHIVKVPAAPGAPGSGVHAAATVQYTLVAQASGEAGSESDIESG